MNNDMAEIFVGVIFVTVFLASRILVLPSFGANQGNRRQLQKRLAHIILQHGDEGVSIVKQKYLKRLGPFERFCEDLNGIKQIKVLLEQAGKTQMAYRFALWVCLLATVMGIGSWWYFHSFLWLLIFVVSGFLFPIAWLKNLRSKRMDQFEEQLPDALQMMSRALRTGYSFLECMKVVATEMKGPISQEFSMTYEEINYGRDIEVAFAIMIERVPSLSLIAMTTAIMIQKETGGNLSEVLLKISGVLSGRFKLQRRIKTLSAEGIMSAWVLLLLPFSLFLVINFLNPEYFIPLYESPDKLKYLEVFFGLEFVAMIWIRYIINVDV